MTAAHDTVFLLDVAMRCYQAHFGFDVAHVVAAAREQIARHARKA